MIRTKGEAGTGDVSQAVKHLREIGSAMKALTVMSDEEHDDAADDAGPVEREAPPASEKQLKFIRVLQDKVELSDEALESLVDEVTGAGLAELTVRNASEVIDELKIKGRELGIDLDAQPAASEKQVGFIRSLKRRALLTDDEFMALLEEQAGVSDPAELGRRDASAVIDQLLKLADKGGKQSSPKKRSRPAPPPADDDDVPF